MHHFKDNLQHLREFKDNAMGQCVSIAHNVGQPAQSGGFTNPVINKDFPGRVQSQIWLWDLYWACSSLIACGPQIPSVVASDDTSLRSPRMQTAATSSAQYQTIWSSGERWEVSSRCGNLSAGTVGHGAFPWWNVLHAFPGATGVHRLSASFLHFVLRTGLRSQGSQIATLHAYGIHH